MAAQYSLFPTTRRTCRRIASKPDHLPLLGPSPTVSRDSRESIEAFPAFDVEAFESCIDSCFTMDHSTRIAPEAFYFQLQPSQEYLTPSVTPVSRKPSVLLPECNLVKSYSQRPRIPTPEKPLPPAPLQPHQKSRKRTNRSVTPTQLEELSRAVSPKSSFEWSSSSTIQGSFSSTTSTAPSLVLSESRSPSSAITSPDSAIGRRTPPRRKFTGPPTTMRTKNIIPRPLNLDGLPMEENPAYVAKEHSPTFPPWNFLPSPDLTSPFPSLPTSPADTNEISGWEPDSDDEEPTRLLRKKISRRFTADRTSRPATSRVVSGQSQGSNVSDNNSKWHTQRISNDSTNSNLSHATTAAQRASRSTYHSSTLSQSTTLMRDSCSGSYIDRDQRVAARVAMSPSIAALPGKRKVKFSRKLKDWFSKS